VKREVWQRDGGQCTFVGATGHRCPARTLLEFDHVEEVARGGHSTVAGLRLRCRAHNQAGAERRFGAGFMHEKRRAAMAARTRKAAMTESARRAAAAEKARKAAEEQRTRRAAAEARALQDEVMPYLRQLGFRADEARRAVQATDGMSGGRLEDRVRASLSWLGSSRARRVPA
jgi:hypothetical protein